MTRILDDQLCCWPSLAAYEYMVVHNKIGIGDSQTGALNDCINDLD